MIEYFERPSFWEYLDDLLCQGIGILTCMAGIVFLSMLLVSAVTL